MKHSLIWLDESGAEIRLGARPVNSFTLTDDIAYIAPQKRVY